MLSDYTARIPARIARLLLLAWALTAAQAAVAGENIKFEAVWDGDFISVSASAELPAKAATAWSVLTDYQNFTRFIPDMLVSRIVSRSGDGLVVEHDGRFGFLFFRRTVRLVLDVVLDPPLRIVSRSLSGDLRELRSSYEMQESAQALRLSYKARFIPATALPPIVGLPVLRYEMEKQFTAMVDEIVRRAALAVPENRAEAGRQAPSPERQVDVPAASE